jgi:radical SAM superfamily enzyme YgiQ (UPF0313 family)
MVIGRLRLKKHGYDFPPYRLPSEAESLLLRVTRGCPWNKCTFCSMYKDVAFERRSLAEIKTDIYYARDLYREVTKTVFLADSNSLVIKADDMVEILDTLYGSFPNIERITSYARAKTLLKKSFDELKFIRDAGLTRLHVGLETGSGKLLEKIRKGITPDEFAEACFKVKDAGFEISIYVFLGLGGEDMWAEHATETAALLSRIDPHYIRVRTLQPQPGSEIYADMLEGRFNKALSRTVLKEQKKFLENTDVSSSYLSDHLTNYLPVNGVLPKDRKIMLSTINESLTVLENDPAVKEKFSRKDRIKKL